MALTQLHFPAPLPAERDCMAPSPDDSALQRLAGLHGETGQTLLLGQFLARAPQACVALMATGAVMLVWAGGTGGGALKASFAWSVLLLVGVVAIIRLHIRGCARSLRRSPLAEAVADLRLLFLYLGLVWGGGAFLIMPDLPAPALVFLFAVLPGLGLGLTLRDGSSFAAFALPAAALTAGASLLGAWPLDIWVAGAILTAVTGLGLGFLWHRLASPTVRKNTLS